MGGIFFASFETILSLTSYFDVAWHSEGGMVF
jgi:hypothetical protein